METTLKIGISACLLGEPVRYDGGHKLDHFLVETLGRFVSFVPVCPETECGLGVPRETMRLTGDPASPRLMTIHSGQDLTARMESWAARRVKELAGENLCGFIFKSRSPSSGMERVKVYADTGGAPTKTGVGLFAKEFMTRFPLLPVEDEGRLHDPVLRENFITRIFVLKRWRDLMTGNRSRGGLVAAGRTVLPETNGSLYLKRVPQKVVKIVDLKCPPSTPVAHPALAWAEAGEVKGE